MKRVDNVFMAPGFSVKDDLRDRNCDSRPPERPEDPPVERDGFGRVDEPDPLDDPDEEGLDQLLPREWF